MAHAEREMLLGMFRAAVGAAAPDLCVPPHLPPPPRGRTVVVGAGKAAAAMARAVEAHWPAERELSGLVVTRYGHGVAALRRTEEVAALRRTEEVAALRRTEEVAALRRTEEVAALRRTEEIAALRRTEEIAALRRIEVVEASHPVPDEAGRAGAGRMLDLVSGLTADDLVLCLISGGASALLALPAPGIDLLAKQAVNRALLRSGAAIDEMNAVRKHLSAIKGGRLAQAAAPAALVTLVISDVPGDDPSVIGSGPTVPDPSTLAQARAVLARWRIEPDAAVAARLCDPSAETPKPGDTAFAHSRVAVIATPQASLEAAASVARAAGVAPIILGNAIEGEAAEVARVMAAIARQCAAHGQPAPAPCVLLSGGETTVTVRGNGRGGRNAEFLLALAVALDGHPGIHAIACDTDGIDGTEDNAGALLSPDSLARAAALEVSARARLADNDGYGFFQSIGDLVVTGPTLTNVNDFRAILITN